MIEQSTEKLLFVKVTDSVWIRGNFPGLEQGKDFQVMVKCGI